MSESRWVRWIGPGVLALWVIGSMSSAAAGEGPKGWVPGACPEPPTGLADGPHAASASPDVHGAPWYRLDPSFGPDGSLSGQVLSVGIVGDSLVRAIALPAESFAAGPFGRSILVGSDDGRSSRLQAVDVARGCAWSIGQSADVIRRATVDPTGTTILEMRVARSDRADLGVWRRPVSGIGQIERILPPPPPDVRFGRTFGTEFTWDTASTRVAVQSCGEIACRTRLLDANGGQVGLVEDPSVGPLIGVAGDTVVSYGACRGFPCPIVATDVRSGAERVIVPDGGLAVIVAAAAGQRLVDEAPAGPDRRLRSTDLASGEVKDLGAIPAGQALLSTSDRSWSGTRIPPGWIVLAADGRLPADPRATPALLRRLPDGLTVPIDEAIR